MLIIYTPIRKRVSEYIVTDNLSAEELATKILERLIILKSLDMEDYDFKNTYCVAEEGEVEITATYEEKESVREERVRKEEKEQEERSEMLRKMFEDKFEQLRKGPNYDE